MSTDTQSGESASSKKNEYLPLNEKVFAYSSFSAFLMLYAFEIKLSIYTSIHHYFAQS